MFIVNCKITTFASYMKLFTDEELAVLLDRKEFRLLSQTADSLGLECYVVGGYVRRDTGLSFRENGSLASRVKNMSFNFEQLLIN